MSKLNAIADVVDYQLCTGCGVCAYLDPKRFRMEDRFGVGRRPASDAIKGDDRECISVCPGRSLSHGSIPKGADETLWEEWGPVLGVWEGYAGDPEIRYAGSSGGAVSGLALYCLEQEGMAGVLHTAAREDIPYLNHTVVSTSREDLLARAGSRYAPASPCEGLERIEKAHAQSVFIGKPCDVAALQRARKVRPGLDDKVGLAIAFFCAGTPSTKASVDLAKTTGVNAEQVIGLRYRGNGWPGMWTVRAAVDSGAEIVHQMTYAESWGFLQRYRQWRCYICPDHTGEFADIALGDPWYRDVEPNEPGKSLIVARTSRGLELVKAAAAAGYVVLGPEKPDLLPRSQPNLSATRGALWGRLLVLRLMGAAVPRFEGFSLLPLWLRLPAGQKVRSITGTVKRVLSKRLHQRLHPQMHE